MDTTYQEPNSNVVALCIILAVCLIIWMVRSLNKLGMVDITMDCSFNMCEFKTNEGKTFYEIEIYYIDHLVSRISNGKLKCNNIQFNVERNLGGGFRILADPIMLK